MITAGIDIGSISTKAAIVKDGILLGSVVIPTGYNVSKAGEKVFQILLDQLELNSGEVTSVVSTGYGRNRVEFADKAVTEITCHATGAYFLNPEIRTVIDIGGQDSKAIVIDENGRVMDFIMNDKCAAGTGRFLEVMARAMEIDLDEFGQISLSARSSARISSLCTVFAETEVISLISTGEPRSSIIAGIHESIASRVVAMGRRIKMEAPVVMTGGVAKNIGVVHAIGKKMDSDIAASEHAQTNGAIGAALLAGKNI